MNSLVLALSCIILAQEPQATAAQPPDAQSTVMIGRVTGNDVYVRSGPSTNFYPVTKLNPEDRVIVHEIRHGWAHITPTHDCYSLVDKQYVDPDGQDKGVINGHRVWVHPGSAIAEGPYYAKQVQLDRGSPVTIVGELDQYYKIAPPAGAKLWMSADYVEIVEDQVSPEAAAAQAQELADAVPVAPSDEDIADVAAKNEIEDIEADLEREFQKDAMERNFQPFIERFQVIAERDGDYAVQQYATYRVSQLQKTVERIAALKEIRELADKVQQQRQAFLDQQSNIRPQTRHIEQNFAARGKLIKSFAYDNPAGPLRFRLVDPEGPATRTIAYVQIDPESGIDVDQYLGRYVGVRAKDQHLIRGAVDAVVVYNAAELVILEHLDEASEDATSDTE